MRSNSGKDEGRNNLHNPTIRDRDLGREVETNERQRTTGMGSAARKSSQKGDRA